MVPVDFRAVTLFNDSNCSALLLPTDLHFVMLVD